MGGVIASALALRWPNHVARLCLIAPAGLPTIKPASASVVKVPLLRNIMMWLGAHVLFGNIRREWVS
jgi:pimeloyl-ACP methyl ester carboxylesterase